MTASFKTEWKALWRSRPGRRFQERYEASRRKRATASLVGRVIRLVLALGLVTIGVVLVLIPGPAIVFFALAGGLLAAESRRVARLLDWTEVKLRRVARWLWSRWCGFSGGQKAAALVMLLAAGAAGLFAGYRLNVR